MEDPVEVSQPSKVGLRHYFKLDLKSVCIKKLYFSYQLATIILNFPVLDLNKKCLIALFLILHLDSALSKYKKIQR